MIQISSSVMQFLLLSCPTFLQNEGSIYDRILS